MRHGGLLIAFLLVLKSVKLVKYTEAWPGRVVVEQSLHQIIFRRELVRASACFLHARYRHEEIGSLHQAQTLHPCNNRWRYIR